MPLRALPVHSCCWSSELPRRTTVFFIMGFLILMPAPPTSSSAKGHSKGHHTYSQDHLISESKPLFLQPQPSFLGLLKNTYELCLEPRDISDWILPSARQTPREPEKHICQVFPSTAFYPLFDTDREFSYNMHASWA